MNLIYFISSTTKITLNQAVSGNKREREKKKTVLKTSLNMSLRTLKISCACEESKFLGILLRYFQIWSQFHLPILTFIPFYSSFACCFLPRIPISPFLSMLNPLPTSYEAKFRCCYLYETLSFFSC